MNIIKRLLFILLILMSTIAIAGPLELAIAESPIAEPTQMLLLGICLVGVARFSRKKMLKK